MLASFSSLVAIVIKGLMIWGSKCHQNNSPVVCDGYVKYEEAEVDRLVAVLKTNNCLMNQIQNKKLVCKYFEICLKLMKFTFFCLADSKDISAFVRLSFIVLLFSPSIPPVVVICCSNTFLLSFFFFFLHRKKMTNI